MASKHPKTPAAENDSIVSEEHARMYLGAISVTAEMLLRLHQDDPDRDLTDVALFVSADRACLVPRSTKITRNTAVIPMPDGARLRHLLKALMVDDGDASIAVKLMSFRFAEAARQGEQLEMYDHEAIGRPAVALHLAVRSEILTHL
ncbi:hypothetical protein HFN72_29545 [Rhizobium laguerreae]|uniref:hypothetical protein n=1 Tax=Rhizobium laguerreae TaxID=1076926 RepID=UPI001C928D24|nr:hypothetical protein [Rhizobium laguerreae]MBY3249923.1 hypothetical protein [Rhizobium laguerreae]MBY3530039.1 hypothetical protein [Rhizobium laguerreae]